MSTTMNTDRVAITASIESMTPDFAALVGEIGEGGWKKKSSIPEWTCGQLAWHVASSASFLAGQIDGKPLNPPAFLRPMLYKVSELRVRLLSRKATPTSVLTDLDAGKNRLLSVLASLDDDALNASATMMGNTHTVGEMFQVPVDHLAEHAAHIRAGLKSA